MVSKEVKVRGFDKGFPPVIVDHHFYATKRGELAHAIDGIERAVIPAESFAGYVEAYPDCKPVIDALTVKKKPAKKKK